MDEMNVVDALAQEIRRVDGSHSLGAAALAEALMPFVRSMGLGWQPIETAPFDGTRVQLRGSNGKLDAGRWEAFDPDWMTPERKVECGLSPDETGGWNTDEGEGPHTHWRPAPPALLAELENPNG